MKTLSMTVLTLSASLISASVLAADYAIDHAHSAVTFETGHLGVSRLPGRFNDFSGSYTWSDEDLSQNSVSIEIQTDSIDTNHTDRDEHLRSPDFFNARQYPTIEFTSTGYEGTADEGVLTGELTMHGVTRDVDMNIVKIGEGEDPWGGFRQGFVATTELMRSDFDIDYFIPNVPDATELTIFIEGIRQ
ncbi:YceI family protein [Saccharospirillum impatiens]|uniref:YceI family protein n=1 Tax=Saccharospirillum impatiens TaxID=169438 RepID=UPI000424296E|nr:YceI family protein [Saccharospirillum impatiens]